MKDLLMNKLKIQGNFMQATNQRMQLGNLLMQISSNYYYQNKIERRSLNPEPEESSPIYSLNQKHISLIIKKINSWIYGSRFHLSIYENIFSPKAYREYLVLCES